MELKVKHIFITAVFFLFSLICLSQMTNHPPQPMMQDPGDGPPCADQVDDGNPETPLPPPPGLCLSINTYIFPLFVLGVLFGAYRIHKIETAKKSLAED